MSEELLIFGRAIGHDVPVLPSVLAVGSRCYLGVEMNIARFIAEWMTENM